MKHLEQADSYKQESHQPAPAMGVGSKSTQGVLVWRIFWGVGGGNKNVLE